MKYSTLNITVPAGIEDGMAFRVKNKGNEVINGVPGDLILVISINENETFKRNGPDILTEKKITVT